MPDIATEADVGAAGRLDWVGMEEIAVPVRLANSQGDVVQSPARVAAFVNLKRAEARGIHMSRLYLHVDRHLSDELLTPCSLRRLLRDFLDSHAELSDRARISIRFDHMVRRAALASDNSGWKTYPVVVDATMQDGAFAFELETEVLYSSTCPCSAALARQLIQEQFAADFSEDKALDRAAVLEWLGKETGIRATPHSQRSSARVRVRLAAGFDIPIVDLIDLIEQALRTPVQTAVKREDEQAFALLNGQNLMFCEDAARRMQQALDDDERILDFWLRAAHLESLHPHDAVAYATKGIDGGYSADSRP
ncbi:MAG TPA: GTP cyclohydrolase FolE2 [Dokdonella sp.]|uniref:GTP cyclohydrolase FolE2 n=1 Tax=Dokdonella sp. TaxID=2291710 RepID=UPI002CB6D182|nr:GTP cyclohydrolase FolE2 [Dokdonella sp.]HOX71942.1 GTP cyclohydrolase FolE2 [Dokdonella sp.]HPG94607.1 GTP cyclohydrolase FolE2 [Dokdonella sp.]HPN80125.1 GTP cyclohydrolase FolE2 [Dokdonella sp.]